MGETKKLSVHRVLSELKTLDKRITDAISSGIYVQANRHSNEKISGMSIDDFNSKVIQSSYDTVVSLIDRRSVLKRAVILSNAGIDMTDTDMQDKLVRHEIAGQSLTLAEIIDFDAVIMLKELFLDSLNSQYRSVIVKVNRENDKIPGLLNTYISVAASGRDKSNKDDAEFIKNISDDFMEKNSFDVVDPLNLQEKIKALSDEISSFKTEVDAIKSEVNATTFIEIPA